MKNKIYQLGNLEKKIKFNEYEKLLEDTKNKLIGKEESNILDFVKNHILMIKLLQLNMS